MLSQYLKFKSLDRHHLNSWLPWLVLLVALPVTFTIWQTERENAELDQQQGFEYRVREASSLIHRQLAAYEHSLLGIQSFYKASNFVSKEEFNFYVSDLLGPERHSGLKAVSFAKYIDVNDSDSYSVISRNLTTVIKRITPSGTRDFYAPILYTVSADSSKTANLPRSNLLLDAFADAAIKDGMYQSVDINVATTSLLVNIDGAGSPCGCFTMQLPIYKNGVDISSLEYRRASIYGWVFVRISNSIFFKETLSLVADGDIEFKIYDGTDITKDSLLFVSKNTFNVPETFQPQLVKTLTIEGIGRDWLLAANSLPSFEANVDYSRANEIGLLGTLTSLVLAGILYLLMARLRTLSDMRKVNKKLVVSEQRWQFALEGAGDVVWDWDITEGEVVFSKRWKEMLGLGDDEPEDDLAAWRRRIHPEDHAFVMESLRETLEGRNDTYSAEYRVRCEDNNWKWILDRGMVVSRSEKGTPARMVGTHADISNLKESEEVIWQHANFDSLTGLPNRRAFYTRLEQEIVKARRSGVKVALIFLDLDGFKEVNDTLGHDQGDFLLKQTATRLVDCVRESDVVARLGGDEFVLIVTDVWQDDLTGLEMVAQEVLHTLSQPFQLAFQTAYISASLGIAIFPDDAEHVEGLMKSVDQAMYASKKKGGSCFTYFTSRMQEIALRRMELSNDLRHALGRRELFIEYQPIVELATGRVYKAEALLRWRHPTRGLIGPAEFIPIAEDTRLINGIGNWVFGQAFQQAISWRESVDPAFQIAVNKSPVQFGNEDFKDASWFGNVQENNALGSLIMFEITEGLLLDASPKVRERLNLLQEMGIQVALDDFGTGYSSLSYLKKFNIDYLKIDRSFVSNLVENSGDLVLCEAMIEMAHRLGMKVVAEGIETAAQNKILVNAGCDFGQGYFLSRPLSKIAFEKFIDENNVANKV